MLRRFDCEFFVASIPRCTAAAARSLTASRGLIRTRKLSLAVLTRVLFDYICKLLSKLVIVSFNSLWNPLTSCMFWNVDEIMPKQQSGFRALWGSAPRCWNTFSQTVTHRDSESWSTFFFKEKKRLKFCFFFQISHCTIICDVFLAHSHLGDTVAETSWLHIHWLMFHTVEIQGCSWVDPGSALYLLVWQGHWTWYLVPWIQVKVVLDPCASGPRCRRLLGSWKSKKSRGFPACPGKSSR